MFTMALVGAISFDPDQAPFVTACIPFSSVMEKTVVMGMLDRASGEVIAHVVPDTKSGTLIDNVRQHVAKGSTVHTDEWRGYAKLEAYGYIHETVNHAAGEYARGKSHTNSIESYFGILKRSIRSTHINVSEKHLPKYLKEFEYRMNLRKVPKLMFDLMLSFHRLSTPRDVLEAPSR